MAVAVQVEGAARLRRTLRAAGDDLTDLKDLHREIGDRIVAPAARQAAPMGPDAGGHIVDTIRAGATKTASIIRAGGKARPYGPVIHWGWHRHHIRPNSWISRAAQETEPRWTARFWEGLLTIVNKVQGAENP